MNKILDTSFILLTLGISTGTEIKRNESRNLLFEL